MRAHWFVRFILVTLVVPTVVGVALAEPNDSSPTNQDRDSDGTLTGVWQGTYANDNDIVSKAYLNISENADGSLSGKWGNGPKSVLAIEFGERVTEDLFQWEAAAETGQKGRYRIRATRKGKELLLDITYTWREEGKIRGLTAVSSLTKVAR